MIIFPFDSLFLVYFSISGDKSVVNIFIFILLFEMGWILIGCYLEIEFC